MGAEENEVEFAQSLDGLFNVALGEDMTANFKARLKLAGLDLDKPLHAAYRRQDYAQFVRIAVEEVYPDLPFEDGLRELGRRNVRGFAETVLGKSVFAMLRLIGVRRALDRLTRAFRSTDNYTDARVVVDGERRVTVVFSQVNGMPTFIQGTLEAGAELIGAKNAKVRILSQPGDGCAYEFSWEE